MSNELSKLPKLNFLVVDDMEAIRTMIRICLQDMGAENVEVASDGVAAWKKIINGKVDVILCDWEMPNMLGIELLKRIRAHEEYKHIPFLLITATNEKANVKAAIEEGVTDYLAKPFRNSELNGRVRKMLRDVKVA